MAQLAVDVRERGSREGDRGWEAAGLSGHSDRLFENEMVYIGPEFCSSLVCASCG
jgi:hypothetical protein